MLAALPKMHSGHGSTGSDQESDENRMLLKLLRKERNRGREKERKRKGMRSNRLIDNENVLTG